MFTSSLLENQIVFHFTLKQYNVYPVFQEHNSQCALFIETAFVFYLRITIVWFLNPVCLLIYGYEAVLGWAWVRRPEIGGGRVTDNLPAVMHHHLSAACQNKWKLGRNIYFLPITPSLGNCIWWNTPMALSLVCGLVKHILLKKMTQFPIISCSYTYITIKTTEISWWYKMLIF